MEAVRDRNLTSRQFSEVEMRRLADSRRAKSPENYLLESSAAMDLRQGFECILNSFKRPGMREDLSKTGCKW